MRMFFSRFAMFFAMLFAFVGLVPTIATAAVNVSLQATDMYQPRPAGETLLCNWDTTCADKVTGNFAIAQGTTSQWAAPGLTDTTKYLAIPGVGQSGTARLDLSWAGAQVSSLSFIIGSLDIYNSVRVQLLGQAAFMIPVNLMGNPSGNQTALDSNRLVMLQFSAPTQVMWMEFATTEIAQEIGDISVTRPNVQAAVPEPATWAMMLAGFGIVGATMRRRSPQRLARLA